MSISFKPHVLALLVSTTLSSAVMAEERSEAHTASVTGFVSALELAKQHDPELRQAYHRSKAEQELDDIAFANFLPSIELSSSYRYSDVDDQYTRNPGRYADTAQVERTEKRQDDYNYQLQLQQSIVNVGSWKAYDSAKEAVRQSEFAYTRAEQELIYRLSEAYLKALLGAQQVYINQEKLESLQLKLDQTTRMNELGVGDRLNVLRATSSRDVARSDLLQAKSEFENAQTQLENITGRHISIPDLWVKQGYSVLPNLAKGTEQEWADQVQHNSSLLAQMANVRSMELEADAQNAQHLPTLSFSFTYSDRHSDDIFSDSTRAIAALNLSLPLYSGGRTSAQTRQAEFKYNAAQAQYEKLLSDKKKAVQLAFSQLSSYRDRLQALNESRKSSAAFLEAAERQADLSLGSQVDVLEARTELYDVRLQFANTLSEYLIADLNLLLETGQLSDSTLQRYDDLFQSNVAQK